jgi:hypothetical protein
MLKIKRDENIHPLDSIHRHPPEEVAELLF